MFLAEIALKPRRAERGFFSGAFCASEASMLQKNAEKVVKKCPVKKSKSALGTTG